MTSTITLAIFMFSILIFPSLIAGLQVSSIYNFGDSHSDTGNLDTAFPNFRVAGYNFTQIPSQHCPYGKDFYRNDQHSLGRFSNGQLLIDYFTDHLQFPLLPPYLKSVTFGSNFQRGANFAFGGACAAANNEAHNPFGLDVQVFEFLRFQHLANITTPPSPKLPTMDSFSDALYVIHIGASDIIYNLFSLNATIANVSNLVVPFVAQTIFNETLLLAQLGGAKNFLLIGQPAMGCQPFYLTRSLGRNDLDRDSRGCVQSYNEIAAALNQQLNSSLEQLRQMIPGSTVVFADLYQAHLDVLDAAESYGFSAEDKLRACCGGGGPFNCESNTLNGVATLFSCGCGRGLACRNSSAAVSWDGFHFTQDFAKVLSTKLFQESAKYLSPVVEFVPTPLNRNLILQLGS